MLSTNNILKNQAFSLIELAIAITIIGLIIASVLTGQELIKVSKLNNNMKKVVQYHTAAIDFRDTYGAWPGDIKNATSFWPTAGTANGNGNKLIEGGALPNEHTRAIQHLLLAGYISDNNNGTTYVNMPLDRCILLAYHGATIYSTPGGTTNGVNILAKDCAAWNGGIAPDEGKAYDKKYDDGIPTSGKIVSFSTDTNDCIKESDGTTNAAMNYTGVGSYNAAQTAAQCGLTYWLPK